MESTSRTLNGRVVFHNDLRQWISLELDAPVCGERTVELFMHDEKGEWTPALQAFRGCLVTTAGALGLPVTGYYSAEIFQDVEKIEPDPNCIRQPLIPDYEKAKPARGIRSYQVKMWFDYLAPQGPVHAIITTDHGVVRPWQAYAHYYLTGGFVFYAYCADKFWMYRLTATPQAKPWMMDNYAVIDPETAGEKHVRRIQLSYSCRR